MREDGEMKKGCCACKCSVCAKYPYKWELVSVSVCVLSPKKEGQH